MFSTLAEVISWTGCSDDCNTDVYVGKFKVRDALAMCIYDRLNYHKRINWSVIYKLADDVQSGAYSSIEDVIIDFNKKYL